MVMFWFSTKIKYPHAGAASLCTVCKITSKKYICSKLKDLLVDVDRISGLTDSLSGHVNPKGAVQGQPIRSDPLVAVANCCKSSNQ